MDSSVINKGYDSITKLKNVLVNPPIEVICEHIIQNGEGNVGMNGALMVDTGIFTGRSPQDKYFVEEASSKDNLWWGPINKKIDESIFNDLFENVINYYYDNEHTQTYIFEGYAGADK